MAEDGGDSDYYCSKFSLRSERRGRTDVLARGEDTHLNSVYCTSNGGSDVEWGRVPLHTFWTFQHKVEHNSPVRSEQRNSTKFLFETYLHVVE